MLMHRAAGFHFRDCWGRELNGLDVVEALQDHPPAAFVKEGETVATYTDPPGRDPLLPRAIGENDVVGEALTRGEEPVSHDADSKPTEGDDEPPEAPATSDDEPLPGEEGEQIDEATRKKEAASRRMPSGDESLDRVDQDMAQAAKGIEEEPEDEKRSPTICCVAGCGKTIQPLDVSWNSPNGMRCAECGPEPERAA
jgi:hypothetical protein